ncbi:MAG: hypothetical protein JJD98_00385 [Polaromonas sp.]|nr:hypothetical protein [Polaromonas sp.]
MTHQLARYENARSALAAVHSYDEVKDIMDQSERAAVYARQANDSELIKYATEIRVRAQRRAGEMLAVTEKATGAQGVGKSALHAVEGTTATLAEMGITYNQSSNWQTLAAMSDEHFEATVEAAKDTAGEVTTAFMLREAKRGKPHGKPKTGPKADAIRQELKAASERGTSMLCSYARLLLDAIRATESFTEEENDLLTQISSAISSSRSVLQ